MSIEGLKNIDLGHNLGVAYLSDIKALREIPISFNNSLSDYTVSTPPFADGTVKYQLTATTQPLLSGVSVKSLITASLQSYGGISPPSTSDGLSSWIVSCFPVINGIILVLATAPSDVPNYFPVITIHQI